MSLTKFVVRVLSEDNQLLAWAEVEGKPEPQDRSKSASCPFWPADGTRKINFIADAAGLATKISVHWCDLDIARVSNVFGGGGVEVHPGQAFTFHMLEPLWLTAGMKDVPLPSVTIRKHIILSPPTGSLASRSEA